MRDTFGLRQQDVDEIILILQGFPAIEEAVLFGSRAKGTYKKGSDVDIAIKGKGIDHTLVITLSALLNEESAMPYFFDIIHYDTVIGQELLRHIDRVGISIFSGGSED